MHMPDAFYSCCVNVTLQESLEIVLNAWLGVKKI